MAELTLWSVLAGWAIGWLLSIHPALRRWMLKRVCIQCRLGKCCENDYGGPHGKRAPRGAISERSGWDAAGAIWVAAWWPIRLVAILVASAAWWTGRGIAGAVLSTPLTQPELERRLREQKAEIDRLSAEIGERR